MGAPEDNCSNVQHGRLVIRESRIQRTQMTHQFMYPKVAPALDTAPSPGSGGPAGSVDTHNDIVSGPDVPSTEGAHERPGPETGRAARLQRP
jgi:hypothetical protein